MTRRSEKVPIRTCVGCGSRDRQTVLLRVRLAADGTLSERERKGRSAYLHADPRCARELPRSKRLARALRANVEHAARVAYSDAVERRMKVQPGEAGSTAPRGR